MRLFSWLTRRAEEALAPSNTGSGTATDVCDSSPSVAVMASSTVVGECPEESVITRTWRVTDACGLSDSCNQTINVVDTTEPEIDCNAPDTIAPPDAPISFTAGAVDNCAPSASVEITGHDCFKYTKKGRRVDKTESCVIAVAGDRITILDSGGVGDHITWTVRASDNCGNDNDT